MKIPAMKVYPKLKSILSHHPCMIIMSITVLICMKSVFAADERNDIIEDLPKAADVDKYLTVLEKIADFCIRHKLYVDLNLEFGLFLISVNLKTTLYEKRHRVPTKVRFRLEQLLLKNDVLADYFHYMVQRTSDREDYHTDRQISKVIYNETTWSNALHKFNTYLLKKTKIYDAEQLEKIYGKWKNYDNNVFNYDKYKPTPDESDACIAQLGRSTNDEQSDSDCEAPSACKQGVKSGSDFGYGLSHRILFMVIARFSRGCTVFSEKEDKYKVDKYCMRSFNEAQYIASNNFQLPDLMMEQMALCGLYGHAQFYQRSWLSKLIESQTSEGCFSEDPSTDTNDNWREGDTDEWRISNLDQSMMNGRCHGHLTAVASAVFASALRYIMENYY